MLEQRFEPLHFKFWTLESRLQFPFSLIIESNFSSGFARLCGPYGTSGTSGKETKSYQIKRKDILFCKFLLYTTCQFCEEQPWYMWQQDSRVCQTIILSYNSHGVIRYPFCQHWFLNINNIQNITGYDAENSCPLELRIVLYYAAPHSEEIKPQNLYVSSKAAHILLWLFWRVSGEIQVSKAQEAFKAIR